MPTVREARGETEPAMRAGDMDLRRDWCEVLEVEDTERVGLCLPGGDDQRRDSYAVDVPVSDMRLRSGDGEGDAPRRV